jgi:ABC-type thiamine transport system substrate-binding protein
MRLTTLLLGDTDGATSAAGSLGVLATDTETPVVTETTVGTDLLQALEIITELGVDTVGEDLAVLAINNIALSVEEPGWDLVLGWVLDDGDDALKLFGGKFTGTKHNLNQPHVPVSPFVALRSSCKI